MQFYADENFSLAVVTELRNLGHNCLTAFEDERANQKIPDEKVLERATELRRAVLTINRIGFKRLHNANSDHTGIVIAHSTLILSDNQKALMRLAKNQTKLKAN